MLTPLVLAADYAGTAVLNDRTDVRGRFTMAHTPGAPTSYTGGLDLVTTPSAYMLVNDRRWSLSLGYTPSFTATEIETGWNPEVFQLAGVGIGWHNRFVTVSLGDAVSFGTFNSAYLFQPGAQPSGSATPPAAAGGTQGLPTTGLQLVPQPQAIYFGSNRTTASVAAVTDRRSSFSLGGSFGLSGGLDDNSRLVEPDQRAIEGDASFSHQVTRTDGSLTVASVTDLNFKGALCFTPDGKIVPGVTCRPDDQIFLLTENFIHAFDKTTSLSVGAGPQFIRARPDVAVPYTSSWYPGGQLSVSHQYAKQGLASLLVTAEFFALPDFRTGLVTERAQLDATVVDIIDPRLSLSIAAGAGQTFPVDSPIAATIVRGNVEADYKTDKAKLVALVGGLSAQFESQDPFGYFFSIFGYFAVTVATPTLRF
jgi:hypothetical protein